ncbi:MAG: hypothetical protein J2P50_17135, partial [Hyphomicrobiaceae bacterium]|nr:hypothetical protein [Hyphomicrobiaceae bacterium]
MPFLIVSLAASGLLVGLMLLAHVLKPEISPRWRMLSELAIGRWGLAMNSLHRQGGEQHGACRGAVAAGADGGGGAFDRCQHRSFGSSVLGGRSHQ